jgi:predicted ATPase
VFGELGVAAQFRVEDIKDVGFRLLFGKSSLQHVGRGISYLLPVVEAGLIADPLRNKPIGEQVSLAEYLEQCDTIAHTALEEPESHTHPKVQTLLAHFMVSLALSGRQILIETHSDHLVRRLRGIIARSAEGSESEQWFSRNVSIVEVEQSAEGVTTLRQSKLTTAGAIAEHWPADFMDEASNEERSIYDAAMEKEARTGRAAQEEYAKDTEFVDGADGEG